MLGTLPPARCTKSGSAASISRSKTRFKQPATEALDQRRI